MRAGGATPATVAVLDGICCVGLEEADLERLARLGPKARKVSRRDLPFAVAGKLVGATTGAYDSLLRPRLAPSGVANVNNAPA